MSISYTEFSSPDGRPASPEEIAHAEKLLAAKRAAVSAAFASAPEAVETDTHVWATKFPELVRAIHAQAEVEGWLSAARTGLNLRRSLGAQQ